MNTALASYAHSDWWTMRLNENQRHTLLSMLGFRQFLKKVGRTPKRTGVRLNKGQANPLLRRGLIAPVKGKHTYYLTKDGRAQCRLLRSSGHEIPALYHPDRLAELHDDVHE
jgi:hypothetical protein